MAQIQLMAGGAGTYNEGNAFQALNFLQQLRSQLESGQISTDSFLQQAKPVAEFVNKERMRLGSGGSSPAKVATQLYSGMNSSSTGYDFSDNGIVLNLPQQFSQPSRNAELPSNIPSDLRNKIISDIPGDIPVESDQFDIEREGLRQSQQQADLAKQQKEAHASSLGDYAKLLAENQQSLFNREIPDLAEQANTKGIYRSTGFGDSLAKEYAKLTADTQNQLGQKAIAYGDLDTNNLANAVNISQSYQGQGLNRKLNLADYDKQLQDAIRYGKEFQPVTPSKTNGEKWAQGIQAGSQAGGSAALIAGGK